MIDREKSIDTLDVLKREAVLMGVNDMELRLLESSHYHNVRQYYSDHPLPDSATQERRETYELSMRMSVAAQYRSALQRVIDGWHKPSDGGEK